MKTIIVINDNTVEAEHAAILALRIAEREKADLLLANEVKITDNSAIKKLEWAVGNGGTDAEEEHPASLLERLRLDNNLHGELKINIEEIDISDFGVDGLAMLIIKNNIWMIVKGTHEFEDNKVDLHINIQYVLNKVMCPLLLVPAKFKVKDFEQIVYMADLRYCRLHVVRYLADFAKPYNCGVYIDHVSAKGLPHMEENYANSVFNSEIKSKVTYDKLFFNNIRERDINKAVDVMINGMHIDLLVIVNHRFHFVEMLGRHIPQILPEQITVPLLIFPY